jgi:hypothetical protein
MAFANLLRVADVAVQKHLGDAVSYAPSVGAVVDVVGVFDAVYVRVDLGNPGVSSVGPVCFLTLSDLPSDPETDVNAIVTVEGDSYSIHEVQKDGKGGVVLFLHRV